MIAHALGILSIIVTGLGFYVLTFGLGSQALKNRREQRCLLSPKLIMATFAYHIFNFFYGIILDKLPVFLPSTMGIIFYGILVYQYHIYNSPTIPRLTDYDRLIIEELRDHHCSNNMPSQCSNGLHWQAMSPMARLTFANEYPNGYYHTYLQFANSELVVYYPGLLIYGAGFWELQSLLIIWPKLKFSLRVRKRDAYIVLKAWKEWQEQNYLAQLVDLPTQKAEFIFAQNKAAEIIRRMAKKYSIEIDNVEIAYLYLQLAVATLENYPDNTITINN